MMTMRFRIDTQPPGSDIWEPGAGRFDLSTPLRVVYGDAQQLRRETGCNTRVVVVTVVEWERIEIVKVFDDVAEPVTPEPAVETSHEG